MLISSAINRLEEFKVHGNVVAQQVASVRGELETAMSKVNMNFKDMAQDFNDQHRVINLLERALDSSKEEQRELHRLLVTSMDNLHRVANMLSNRMSKEMSLGVQLCQDMSLLMAWLKEMEDGMIVSVQFLHLQISTFDKSSTPTLTHSCMEIASLSFPLYTYPPLRPHYQDRQGQEHKDIF